MRKRLLRLFADQSILHPRRTLLLLLMVTLGFAATLPHLRITAGHSAFVDEDRPEQVQFRAFMDRFGSPNMLVLVVEGGDEALRRQAIDGLVKTLPGPPGKGTGRGCVADGLPGLPDCVNDVLGGLDLDQLASRALLYTPTDKLADIVDVLKQDELGYRTLRDLKGFDALVLALTAQMEEGADAVAPEGEALDQAREAMKTVGRFFQEVADRVTDPGRSRVPLADALFDRRGAGGLDAEGYLSSGDGKMKLALVRPFDSTDDPRVVGPFVRYVQTRSRASVAELGEVCAVAGRCPEGPLRVSVTGLPAVIADEADVIASDVVFTGFLATLGLFLVLLMGFRSPPKVILALMPLALVLTWAMGITQVLYGALTMVTAAAVPTLLGLGVDFAVHLLARYDEARAREDVSNDAAIREAIMEGGPGILTGGLTTAGAFLVLGVIEFKGFREMGVVAGVGLIGALLITFTFLPAMLSFDRLSALRGPLRAQSQRGHAWLRSIPERLVAHAATVLGVAVAAAMAMVWIAQDIPWSYDYAALLPADVESTTTMVRVAKDTDFSTEVAAMDFGSLEEVQAAVTHLEGLDSVDRVEAITKYLPEDQPARLALVRGLEPMLRERTAPPAPAAIDVASIADNLQELSDAMEDAHFDAEQAGSEAATLLTAPMAGVKALREALKATEEGQASASLGQVQSDLLDARDRVVEVLSKHVDLAPVTVETLVPDLPESMRARLVADGRYAVYVYPSKPVGDPAFLEGFYEDLRGVHEEATGFPVTHWLTMGQIKDGFLHASALALLALILMLLLDFRRVRLVALTVVPLGLGVCWTWGLISLLGIAYDAGNVVALPLILGITVDSGVHIVHRFRAQGGRNVVDVVRYTGWAVLLSGVTSMAGFGALSFARHVALGELGLILVLGVGSGLLAATVVLPALLQVIRRWEAA